MRATLPLRPVPRTPACPGFGVSGDRKRACFDRSCRGGAVSSERRLLGFPRRWGPTGVDGGTHRGQTLRRGFERVQMSVGGGRIGLDALTVRGWAPSIERVQLSLPGRQVLERLIGAGGLLPFERVQMDCGSGAPGPSEPDPPLGSFERVRTTPAFAFCVARGRSAHRGSHHQSHRGLVAARLPAPANEYRLPHTAHHRRASMPPLK